MPSRLQMSKHTTEGRNCPPEDGRKRTSVQPQEGEPDFLERLRDGICTICLCAGRIRGERKLACPDRTPFQGWQVVFHHSGALQLPVHHWRVPAACEERLGVQDGFLQIQPLHWNMGLHCSTVEGKTLSKRVDGMDWPIGFFFFFCSEDVLRQTDLYFLFCGESTAQKALQRSGLRGVHLRCGRLVPGLTGRPWL